LKKRKERMREKGEKGEYERAENKSERVRKRD